MTSKPELTQWDTVTHLVDEESIRLYLEAALEESASDLDFLGCAMGDLVHARAVNEVAVAVRMPREVVYEIFTGKRQASPAVLAAFAQALGYRITFDPPSVAPVRARKPRI